MRESIIIEPAKPAEYEAVCALLQSQKLPVEDIDRSLPGFFVARHKGKIVSVIGLEVYDQYGLLRSMATDPEYRNQGIAGGLVQILMEHVRNLGLLEIYLLTETAATFFTHKGFGVTGRSDVPLAIQQSPEFTHICPSTAVVMKKEIT